MNGKRQRSKINPVHIWSTVARSGTSGTLLGHTAAGVVEIAWLRRMEANCSALRIAALTFAVEIGENTKLTKPFSILDQMVRLNVSQSILCLHWDFQSHMTGEKAQINWGMFVVCARWFISMTAVDKRFKGIQINSTTIVTNFQQTMQNIYFTHERIEMFKVNSTGTSLVCRPAASHEQLMIGEMDISCWTAIQEIFSGFAGGSDIGTSHTQKIFNFRVTHRQKVDFWTLFSDLFNFCQPGDARYHKTK